MANLPLMLTGMDIGEKIRARRQQLGLSQGDVAARLGVAQPRLSKWENGEGEPGPSQIHSLAIALKVSVEYLCDPVATVPYGHRELTEDEQLLARLIERLGVGAALDRILNAETKKRADPVSSEEKPSPPVESSPTYGRPLTRPKKPRSSE